MELYNQYQDMMKPNEVAAVLRVSVRTLEAWRSKKKGPKYRHIMGGVRYMRDDIQMYIEQS